MLCFKFNQNRAINEKFDFRGGQIVSGVLEGGRGTRFKKNQKTSYRTVVSPHTENFSFLAPLERVQKSEELNRLLGGCRPPKVVGESDIINSKKLLTEKWSEPTAKITAP